MSVAAAEIETARKRSFSLNWFAKYGLVFYIILTTAGVVVTSEITKPVLDALRSAALLASSLALIGCLMAPRFSGANQLRFLLFAWFVCAGTLIGAHYGGLNAVDWMHFSISTLGVVIMASRTQVLASRAEEKWLLRYFLALLALTYMFGGVTLTMPPQYILSYAAGVYSPSISFVFGLAAVIAFTMAVRRRRAREIGLLRFWLLALLTIVFLGHSFIGGGRGELLIACFVIYLVAFTNYPAQALIGSLFAAFVLVQLLQFEVQLPFSLGDSLAFERLTRLFDGNLSDRDILISKAIEILQNPVCFVTGCGFGYFELQPGYTFGLSPHNFTLEMAVSVGVPFTAIFIFAMLRGIVWVARVDHYRLQNINLTMGLFTILHAHKSWSVTGAFLAMAFSFYFAGLSMRRFKS